MPPNGQASIKQRVASYRTWESRHRRRADLRRLVHGLRHTFANANVSVYTLMKLLGHESMVTSQRYVDGAGTDTRAAAELNPLYELLTTDQWES